MQKHPMYTVKEAAAALGCDERWVREQLNQGQLKGEKKSIGMKDKWFVFKGEVDQALARKGVSATVSAESVEENKQQFFGVEPEDAETIEENSASSSSAGIPTVQELVKVMAQEFAQKLDEKTAVARNLQKELDEMSSQLKLLPDLQAKAKAAEEKHFELEALKKQLESVQELKDKAEAEATKAKALEENVVPELQQKVEAERLAKEKALAELSSRIQEMENRRLDGERSLVDERTRKDAELAKLQSELAVIDEYKQSAEQAKLKVDELERVAAERAKTNEETAKALEELQKAKEEKDAQVAAMQEQMSELSTKLENANKSGFWRKFFFGRDA